MKFLSYGSAKALGLRHDFDKDIDRLYQREAYRANIEARKAEKARYYGQFLKEGTAAAPSNVKRLKTLYDDLNNSVADFMIEHGPALETDIGLQQQFLNMTDEYLNNPIIREDQQVQQEFNKLKEAINTGKVTPRQAEVEMEKYTNYFNEGGDPYIFSNLLIPDYSEILKDSNAALEPETTIEKEGHMFIHKTDVPEENYMVRALMDMNDEDKAQIIQKRFEDVNSKNPGFYKNAVDMHIRNLKAGEMVKKTLAAFDPGWGSDLKNRQRLQAELAGMSPWYAQEIAPEFKLGNSIQGTDHMMVFTGFHNTGGTWDLGSEGTTVKVQDEKGNFRDVKLSGELVATNTKEMKIMQDGAYIKVDVRTNVNPSEKFNTENPRYKYQERDENGKFVEIEKDVFDKHLADMKARKRVDIEAGHEVDGLLRTTTYGIKGAEYYENAGFTSKGVYVPGLSLPGIDKQTGVFPVYSGTIWVPANINASTLAEYERSAGTKEQASKLKERLTTEGIIYENTLSGNQQFATEVLRDTYGGDWQQHPENPGFYIKEENGIQYGYNVMTGQIGKFE